YTAPPMIRRRFILLAATALLALASRPSAAPTGQLRIALIVDSSSAIAPMLTQFRAALLAFIEALPEGQEVTIISTGGQLRVRVPPTSDRDRLRQAARAFASDGGANAFVDTLLETDKRFLQNLPDRRPVVVIVTTDANNVRGEPRVD